MAARARQSPASEVQESRQQINFEEAMAELESIVHAMEEDRLPLEELVSRYERGMNLLRICREQIEAARQRIEIVAAGPAGQAALKPFSPEGAASSGPQPDEPPPRTGPPSAPEEDPDEIRLF